MKNHIVEELKSAGLSGAEAEHAFNQVADAIAKVIRRGDRVRIPGVGILARKTRNATTKFNPRTRERMSINAYDVVALHNPERF